MTATPCYWYGDPAEPQDCYCPSCISGQLLSQEDQDQLDRGEAIDGTACVRCDRLATEGRFTYPPCEHCGMSEVKRALLDITDPRDRVVYACEDCIGQNYKPAPETRVHAGFMVRR
jgi:hypothetical protein